MKIDAHDIRVKEVISGYTDNDEEGVYGYGGKLNIRPKYQREFIYDMEKQRKVIETVNNGFPLNVMYWVKNGDGSYEVLDGQQRILSLCKYAAGEFSLDGMYFHNLPDDRKRKILDYRLTVYFCEGSDSEKLEWFKIINIAGEKLNDQEMLNALYTGEWLTDAKRHFSKTGCVAFRRGERYMSAGSRCIRQDYLETVLDWISGGEIMQYMAKHQHDTDADELWQYYQRVLDWAERLFTKYRREMKGLPWGVYYNEYHDRSYNANKLEQETARLMADEDVTKKSGIYEYLLSGDERWLNIRAFSDRMKREAYERQEGICVKCRERFAIEEMEADHITPWSKGGATEPGNCQMLCRDCNRRKSDR